MKILSFLGPVLALVSIPAALAATADEKPLINPTVPDPHKSDTYVYVDALINNTDADARKKGVDEITKLLTNKDSRVRSAVADRFVSTWMPAMIRSGQTDEFIALSVPALIAHAQSTDNCEAILIQRARTLLAAKKTEEALAEAKAYYNVCSIDRMGRCIDFVSEMLKAARPDDKGIVRRFKLEQATLPDDPGLDDKDKTETVLQSIKITTTEYDKSIEDAKSGSFDELKALGNMLLIAGQCKDGRKIMERAYSTAKEIGRKNEACNMIARAYKAEQGTPTRAKEWMAAAKAKLKEEQAKVPANPEGPKQF